MNPSSLFTLLLLFALSNSNAQQINQEINKEIKLENDQTFLVGPINENGLSSNSYQTWYEPNYEDYQVDDKIVASMKNQLANHKILVFMATWCGDSKREVPKFMKILKRADFPLENLKMIAVDLRKDKYKKSPTGEEWGLSVKRVPTFIFYKDGKETNRIIESPIISLEADIRAIVTNSKYTPNHATSLHFD